MASCWGLIFAIFGGRALETLVKQHEENSLFVKQVADDATVDIAMPSPCTASSHAISVKGFRWRTRSDHVTRNALAARNNEVYGQGKTADSGSVQSFATIKNTGHGNFVIGRFHTRARNGLSV